MIALLLALWQGLLLLPVAVDHRDRAGGVVGAVVAGRAEEQLGEAFVATGTDDEQLGVGGLSDQGGSRRAEHEPGVHRDVRTAGRSLFQRALEQGVGYLLQSPDRMII